MSVIIDPTAPPPASASDRVTLTGDQVAVIQFTAMLDGVATQINSIEDSGFPATDLLPLRVAVQHARGALHEYDDLAHAVVTLPSTAGTVHATARKAVTEIAVRVALFARKLAEMQQAALEQRARAS